MKKSRIKKIVRTVCVAIGVMIVATSCGGPPTLGQEIKDDGAFEQLESAKIKVPIYNEKGKETKEKLKLAVVVPTSDDLYSTDDRVTASKAGVKVEVKADKIYDSDLDSPKKILQDEFDYNQFDIKYYSESKSTHVKKINDGYGARNQTFAVAYDKYEDTYRAQCFTSTCLKVAENGYINVEISVDENDTNSSTDKIIEELEAFYMIDIYRDKEKAEATNKEYRDNPPTTKTVSQGSVNFSIPKDWEEDTDAADYPLVVYAPGGNFDPNKGHIISYHTYTRYRATEVTAATQAYLKEALGADSLTISKIDSDLKGASVYQGNFVVSGVTFTGYFVFTNYEITLLTVVSQGTPSAAVRQQLDAAYQSFTL